MSLMKKSGVVSEEYSRVKRKDRKKIIDKGGEEGGTKYIEPCGMPEHGKPSEEYESATQVTCERFERYDLNQETVDGDRPR